MKYRAERRRLRSRKIKQRINLIRNKRDRSWNGVEIKEEGYYSNNSELNKTMTGGCSIKTKSKNSHSNYRRPGVFGTKAILYKPRDQRQVDEMEDQLKEYND